MQSLKTAIQALEEQIQAITEATKQRNVAEKNVAKWSERREGIIETHSGSDADKRALREASDNLDVEQSRVKQLNRKIGDLQVAGLDLANKAKKATQEALVTMRQELLIDLLQRLRPFYPDPRANSKAVDSLTPTPPKLLEISRHLGGLAGQILNPRDGDPYIWVRQVHGQCRSALDQCILG